MQQARAKNFTKFLSAVVSPDDYDYLKNLSKTNKISLGDVIREIIKKYKEKEELTNNNEK